MVDLPPNSAALPSLRQPRQLRQPRPHRARWPALLLLGLAATLLHALLLGGMAASLPGAGAASKASTMQVRTLPAPERAAAEAEAEADNSPAPSQTPSDLPLTAPPTAKPAARPQPKVAANAAIDAASAPRNPSAPSDADALAPDSLALAPATPAEPASAPLFNPPLPADLAAAANAAAAALAASANGASSSTPNAAANMAQSAAGNPGALNASAADGAAADSEMPLYKTLIPPPLTLHYDLRRGFLSGTGTLVWRPDGSHYEARLEGRVAGINVLTQVSQGGFDDAGLAPLRYTDQRMGREVRAANFQREVGKITFSGPSTEFTLLQGTQDRLSWMIQLAAVVSAEPKRLLAGAKVALYVVGARGDAALWVFRCIGQETLQTPVGPVLAVKFSREARGPYDTQADAWLDPARHGLPVRALLATGTDGEPLELLLRELQLP